MIRPHHRRARVQRHNGASPARPATSAATAVTATGIGGESGQWPDARWRDVQAFAVPTDASRAEASVRDTGEAADGDLHAVPPAAGGARGPAGNS